MRNFKFNVSISLTTIFLIGFGIWIFIYFLKNGGDNNIGVNIRHPSPQNQNVEVSQPIFFQPHQPPGYYIFHKDSLRLIIPFTSSSQEQPPIPIIRDTTYQIVINQPPRIRTVFRTYGGIGINKSDKYAVIGIQLLKIWDFYAGISLTTQKEINISFSKYIWRRFLISVDIPVFNSERAGLSLSLSF